MTDPLQGLRFDIYERVHLPDDVPAIEVLEEIELVPHMQVLPQDDQVLLRGHLLLSGVYVPQDSTAGGVSQLEHWIPVEITLPLNRVEKVEDLAVEIDNFDVDLLSTRSLNVTGVLALRGLQVAAPHIPVWRDDSFTVVHQAPVASEAEELYEEQEERLESSTAAEALGIVQPEEGRLSEPAAVPEYSPPYYPTASVKEAGVWPIAHQEPEPQADAAAQPVYDLEQWIRDQEADTVSGYETEQSQTEFYEVNAEPAHTGWGDLSGSRPEPEITIQDDYTPAPEDKPEMKVALGGKPLEVPAQPFSGVGFLSQLGDKGAAREAELQAIRSAQAEAQAAEAAEGKPSRTSTGDELEWTKLFLNKGADSQTFRKVKMCIVQREDTLEAIATRYNVQTRELQLHNRLNDPYLSAGQVLYIP